jgi:hypothetical protein
MPAREASIVNPELERHYACLDFLFSVGVTVDLQWNDDISTIRERATNKRPSIHVSRFTIHDVAI